MNTLLAVDGNYLCHVSYYAHKELSYEGTHTGTLYGFLMVLSALTKLVEPDRIAIAWDSKANIRKVLYSGYKGNRQPSPVDCRFVRDHLDKFLNLKDQHSHPGYEADDILAVMAWEWNAVFRYVFTGDRDLFQILGDDVFVVLPPAKGSRKGPTIYGAKHLYRDHGLRPSDWLLMKSIAGCSTDCVEGIRGVGEATAVKYINGTLPHTTKAYRDISSDEGQATIERNKAIVRLPLDDGLTVEEIDGWYVDLFGLHELIHKYAMGSLVGYGVMDVFKAYNKRAEEDGK